MHYYILCPSKDEYEGVVKRFKESNILEALEYYKTSGSRSFKYLDDFITIKRLGIGRTLSSFNLSRIIENEKPQNTTIILCGVCGAISNNLKTGDIVYPRTIKVGDFNIGVQDSSGIADSDKVEIPIDCGYKIEKENLYQELGCIPSHIVTIDSFADSKKKEELKLLNSTDYPSIVDMETATIFSLLKFGDFHKNFYVLRAVADSNSKNLDALNEYESTLDFAVDKVANTCYSLIERLLLDFSLDKYQVDFIKDFPKPGINFLDIQSIIKNPPFFKAIIFEMKKALKDLEFNKIVALDARGFIFGTALAMDLNVPLIMARKKGKLPGDCYSVTYDKEYGKDTIEIEANCLSLTDKVVIIDDVIVTGGTVSAVEAIVNQIDRKVLAVVTVASIGTDYKDIVKAPVKSILKY